jgi:hypothetical protein
MASKDCRLVNNSALAQACFMHEKQKLIERVIVGLAACAISIDVLATELPRVMPYLIVLAVIFVIVRLVVMYTNRW